MPVKQKDEYVALWKEHAPKKAMTFGFLLFLLGLLRFYNQDWSVVWMVIGAVIFLKGLMMKAKKK